MNPAHLATLLAVLDEGTFEAAAHSLGITPSAVSQRIKALESQAGRVLVRRSTPPTTTQAGEVFAQLARRMQLLQAEAEAEIGSLLSRVPLTVAVNADSLATWFRDVISEVAHWDNATLNLRVEDEAATLNLLRLGEVVGAITSEPTSVAGCDVVPIGEVRYYACATPSLAAAHATTEPTNGELYDLQSMPSLRYGPNDRMSDRLISFNELHHVSEIPSSEAYLHAVTAGLGWGLLPEAQCASLLEEGKLVRVDPRDVIIPMFWQQWRLESDMLSRLRDVVISAAPRPASTT